MMLFPLWTKSSEENKGEGSRSVLEKLSAVRGNMRKIQKEKGMP